MAYLYDGTLEGMLSCVFEAYASREDPVDIVKKSAFMPRLGQRAKVVATDRVRACRVENGLIRTCGRKAYEAVGVVHCSDDPAKGRAILEFVRYAMRRGPAAVRDIAHERVRAFAEMERSVRNEKHQWQQFLRFEQVEGGVYVARCDPKANVVTLLMDWFAARFNTQSFVIYDELRRIAGVSRGGSWVMIEADGFDIPAVTGEERIVAQAWKRFYDAVAIETRTNHDLRKSFMPERFWKNMTEMKEALPRDGMYEAGLGRSDRLRGGDVRAEGPGVISGSPCSSAPRLPK